jgi:guanylate kinase
VIAELRRHHPEVWLSTSVTTRPPRPGEVAGRHYHFIGNDEFDDLIALGGLLEWAQYGDARYGTPAAPVRSAMAEGWAVLLELDLAGVRQARTLLEGARTVLIAPPSWEELERRLAGRGTETAAGRARRLAIA